MFYRQRGTIVVQRWLPKFYQKDQGRKRETTTFHSGGTSCPRYDQKDSAEAGMKGNVASLNPPYIEQDMCVAW